jgi:hypothetical protein
LRAHADEGRHRIADRFEAFQGARSFPLPTIAAAASSRAAPASRALISGSLADFRSGESSDGMR